MIEQEFQGSTRELSLRRDLLAGRLAARETLPERAHVAALMPRFLLPPVDAQGCRGSAGRRRVCRADGR